MLMNAYIVMNCDEPVEAEAQARAVLAKQTRTPELVMSAALFMPVEIIPAGWGYPKRCMVTFSPNIRDLPPVST